MPELDPIAPQSRFVHFRNAFISGLLLLLPLLVTVWLCFYVINVVGSIFLPLLPVTVRDHQGLVVAFDLLTTAAVVLGIAAVGFVSRDVFGRFLVSISERAILSLPGLNAVYATVKQIVSTFGTKNRQFLQKVVLVEFPRKGVWVVGFLTGKPTGEIPHRIEGETLGIFIPTTPNPTSGFLLFVPRSDIVELEMSVGEGMKMIISGGAVIPSWPAPKTVEPAR